MYQDISAVFTSGGEGSRNWPINLLARGMYQTKGLMRVMGVPIVDLQLLELKAAGVTHFHNLAAGMPNIDQLSNRLRDGSGYGVTVTHPETEDLEDAGSGDGLLRYIQNGHLSGHSIVLANDSLSEVDWDRAIEFHKKNNAAITILTTYMGPRETIGSYGLLEVNGGDRVTDIIEKPESEADLMKSLGVKTVDELNAYGNVPVNTAGYIVSNDALVKLAEQEWVRKGRESGSFDMAGDLIKGCIDDVPVYSFTIDGWADFGTREKYLASVQSVLTTGFPSVYRVLRERDYVHLNDQDQNVWIEPGTWGSEVPGTGKSLEQLVIDDKVVSLGPNVSIARRVRIGPGAHIEYSAVEKNGLVRAATILHSVLSPYDIIGNGVRVERSVLGLKVSVNHPGNGSDDSTNIVGSFIGPNISIGVGSNVRGSVIFPPESVPPYNRPDEIEPGSEIRNEVLNAPE